jgi:hypothetical protein
MKMARFKLEMNCDNAAFSDDAPFDEIGRIIADLARRFESLPHEWNSGGVLHDINGNAVGRWSLRV